MKGQTKNQKSRLWTMPLAVAVTAAKNGLMMVAMPTLFVAAVITACETPTDNQIEQARQCSNSAASMALTNPPNPTGASAAATACEQQMVSEGLTTSISNGNPTTTTPAAGSIQFGLILIEDQLMTGIATAAQSTGKSGAGSLSAALPALVANPVSGGVGSAQASNDSNRMSGAAASSGDPNLVYVANLIGMATTLSTLSGSLLTNNPNLTPAQVASTISNCIGTCATNLQASYTNMANAACGNGAGSNSTLCQDSQAITNSCTQPCTGNNFTNALSTYITNH